MTICDQAGNRTEVKAVVTWGNKETLEQPNYIIPDLIKLFIEATIVSVAGGKGNQNEPLSLQVLDSVDVDTLTTMIESFGAYRLTFQRNEQQDQPSIDNNQSDETTLESKPLTDYHYASTTTLGNKLQTRMTLNLPLIFGGMMTTLSGIVAT